jgi:hypothetical protein
MSELWLRWSRIAPILLGVAACGGDQGSSGAVTCGQGTVLKDAKCIPQCGTGSADGRPCNADGQGGAAGNASQGGKGNDSANAGSQNSEAGSAGESEAEGGSAGESEAEGGSAGLVIAGSGGTAGSGGSSGMAGANAGAAGSAGSDQAPQWLTFNHSAGIVAYDATKFPSASALVTIDSKTNGSRAAIWSPDGHWLLYQSGPDVYCRDMTSAVPGPAMLMARIEAFPSIRLSPVTWSPDSKSAAVTMPSKPPGGGPAMIQVFDPSRSSPVMSTLSDGADSLTWAPVGDRVLYVDFSGGAHVRRVQSGVIGPDLPLTGVAEGAPMTWAPDGNAIIAFSDTAASPTLVLIDLTESAPTPVPLSNPSPSVASPTATQPVFSSAGMSALFMGAQERDAADLYRVALKPTVGAPVRISTGLTGSAAVNSFFVSPDDKWVVYRVAGGNGPYCAAVDVSGEIPGTPFPVVALPANGSSWLPGAPGKYLALYDGSAVIVDLATPGASPIKVMPGVSNALLKPGGSIIASGAPSRLYVRDIDHLDGPIGEVALAATPSNLRWSRDGKYLAFTESSYARLVRVDGATPSSALQLYSTLSTPTLAWQP